MPKTILASGAPPGDVGGYRSANPLRLFAIREITRYLVAERIESVVVLLRPGASEWVVSAAGDLGISIDAFLVEGYSAPEKVAPFLVTERTFAFPKKKEPGVDFGAMTSKGWLGAGVARATARGATTLLFVGEFVPQTILSAGADRLAARIVRPSEAPPSYLAASAVFRVREPAEVAASRARVSIEEVERLLPSLSSAGRARAEERLRTLRKLAEAAEELLRDPS